MARSKDGAPVFPDPNRPLYTPDETAQQQVAERIAQARQGKRQRKPKASGTSYRKIKRHIVADVDVTPHKPMGQHPNVSYKTLGMVWGMGKTKARELAEHPENLNPWQVRQLCDLCGVTLEWLRGETDVNAYGLYETQETVAAIYARLTNEDRRLVSDMLTRLVGAETVRAIKDEQWERDNREWLNRNPEIREAFDRMVQSVREYAFSPYRAAVAAAVNQQAGGIFTEAISAVMEWHNDEWQAIASAALDAAARGDSMEGESGQADENSREPQ